MLSQENVSVLEALKEDLETSGLCGKGLRLALELAAVPKGVVEGFGCKPDDVCVGDKVSS